MTGFMSLMAEIFRMLSVFLIGLGIGFMFVLHSTDLSHRNTQISLVMVDNETNEYQTRHEALKQLHSPQLLLLGASQVGRLGNLLFEYAAAYGVSRKVSKQLQITESSELLALFPAIRDYAYVTASDADIFNRSIVGDPKHCGFAPSVVRESYAPYNIVMSGYFQSWRYFDEYRNDLRMHLRFSDSIQQEVDSQLFAARKRAMRVLKKNGTKVKQLTWIAVHVRRGDIVTSHFASYGYEVATHEYLKKSADYFVQKYSTLQHGVVFLVFSDDIDWCKSNFPRRFNVSQPRVHVEFVSNERAEVDMCMMARCNATIMTVGSFGWWAAYLAGGETFYYAFPYRRDSDLATQFDMEDYYVPDWHLFF